jgi:hypothetical protein
MGKTQRLELFLFSAKCTNKKDENERDWKREKEKERPKGNGETK